MKIRNGFISNSSSSSFVMILPNGHPFIKRLRSNEDDDMETYYSIHQRADKDETIIFGEVSHHDKRFEDTSLEGCEVYYN